MPVKGSILRWQTIENTVFFPLYGIMNQCQKGSIQMGKQTPKTGYDAAYVKTLEASVQELRDENERLRQKQERK